MCKYLLDLRLQIYLNIHLSKKITFATYLFIGLFCNEHLVLLIKIHDFPPLYLYYLVNTVFRD